MVGPASHDTHNRGHVTGTFVLRTWYDLTLSHGACMQAPWASQAGDPRITRPPPTARHRDRRYDARSFHVSSPVSFTLKIAQKMPQIFFAGLCPAPRRGCRPRPRLELTPQTPGSATLTITIMHTPSGRPVAAPRGNEKASTQLKNAARFDTDPCSIEPCGGAKGVHLQRASLVHCSEPTWFTVVVGERRGDVVVLS